MAQRAITLSNCVHWDRSRGDKVYMDRLHLAISDVWFVMRQVSLRFEDGPAIDLSIYDMDRIVLSYLRKRGIKTPPRLLRITEVTTSVAPDSAASDASTSNPTGPDSSGARRSTKRRRR
jgi:hypothetical protein